MAAIAITVAAVITPSVSAASPADNKQDNTPRIAHFKPVKPGGVSTQSAGSGARTGDWNHDGFPDIMLRNQNTGQLLVALHSGTYNGTVTYLPPVVINNGWNNARWIGQADINGDGYPDVLAMLPNGEVRGYLHSGKFDGTNTLLAWPGPGERPVLAYNMDIYSLLFTGDVTGDGKDDIFGRRAGTGRTFVQVNTGDLVEGAGFGQAQLFVTGPSTDVEQNLADVTKDGKPDLIFVQPDGVLGAFSLADGVSYSVSSGWQPRTALTLTDINKDGSVDLLARRGSDSGLDVLTHKGTFDKNAPQNTFNVPVGVGFDYGSYDVIS